MSCTSIAAATFPAVKESLAKHGCRTNYAAKSAAGHRPVICAEREQTPRVVPARHSAGQRETSHTPSVHQATHSPGQPLDTAIRALMEPRFGHDFSNVRIHADEQAMESARGLGAKAYTVGSHVVFGKERYAPSALEGQTLIAHELTHVVQQARNPSASVVHRDPDLTLPKLPDVQLTFPHTSWRDRVMPPPPRLNLNILYGS